MFWWTSKRPSWCWSTLHLHTVWHFVCLWHLHSVWHFVFLWHLHSVWSLTAEGTCRAPTGCPYHVHLKHLVSQTLLTSMVHVCMVMLQCCLAASMLHSGQSDWRRPDQLKLCLLLRQIEAFACTPETEHASVNCQPRPNSERQQLDRFLSSFRLQFCMTVMIASEMHFNASHSLTQPLLGCIHILYLTLTQYPYDPGTLPSSANQCILGKVYLRSSLSKKQCMQVWTRLWAFRHAYRPEAWPNLQGSGENLTALHLIWLNFAQLTNIPHVYDGVCCLQACAEHKQKGANNKTQAMILSWKLSQTTHCQRTV